MIFLTSRSKLKKFFHGTLVLGRRILGCEGVARLDAAKELTTCATDGTGRRVDSIGAVEIAGCIGGAEDIMGTVGAGILSVGVVVGVEGRDSFRLPASIHSGLVFSSTSYL